MEEIILNQYSKINQRGIIFLNNFFPINSQCGVIFFKMLMLKFKFRDDESRMLLIVCRPVHFLQEYLPEPFSDLRYPNVLFISS